MRNIRVGLASVDTTVGAFHSNTEKVIAAAQRLAADGCDLCCFQEQVISGYPAEDLVLWDGFVRLQWKELIRIAEASLTFAGQPVLVVGLSVKHGEKAYNVAAVICAGEILGLVPKERLPTYDVFYEGRTFTSGVPFLVDEVEGVPFGDLIFEFPFGTVAVEVCEDIWFADGPMRRRAFSGAELAVNCSSSPWRSGVVETRREMIAARAKANEATVVYVNQCGGNDSLVFDGGGFVFQNGIMLFEAPRWEESTSFIDIDLDLVTAGRAANKSWQAEHDESLQQRQAVKVIKVAHGPHARQSIQSNPAAHGSGGQADSFCEELLAAMQTGLAGYFGKSGAFSRLGISLSGGRDSVLSLIVAWLFAQRKFDLLCESAKRDAIADFVHCFSLPTRFNSAETKSVARMICEDLGVTFVELPIEDAFAREIEAARAMLPHGVELSALTVQNIQSRIRAMRMWNWSNSARGLWLQTGNMSEKAVGYTTIGGDLMGGYSLLGNMPKTVVNTLLDYLFAQYRWKSLELLLRTKATAELAEDQEDERDLMPFPVLDACFEFFAEDKLLPDEVLRKLRTKFSDDDLRAMRADYKPEMLEQWVKRFIRLFVGSIYKWVQAPQAVHLHPLDLDRERALQLPVIQSQEWLNLK